MRNPQALLDHSRMLPARCNATKPIFSRSALKGIARASSSCPVRLYLVRTPMQLLFRATETEGERDSLLPSRRESLERFLFFLQTGNLTAFAGPASQVNFPTAKECRVKQTQVRLYNTAAATLHCFKMIQCYRLSSPRHCTPCC